MQLKAFCSLPFHARTQKGDCLTKTLLVMRLTGILLVAGFLQVGAHGRAQTVTFTAKDMPLPRVFAAIEQQTGYVFFYDKAWLEGTRPVTVELKAEPLRAALEQVLDGQPIGFEIREGNTIVLTKRAPSMIVQALPPPGDIHGRVTDSLGNPLAGASVTVKGTHKGAQTGTDGSFELKGVDDQAVLVVSFTGYGTETIALHGRKTLFVQLRQGVTSMQDVVINKGYYTTTQRLNTGNVSIVKSEDIQKQPVGDPLMALEGRVPGLYIAQVSGIPGASELVRLRGQNSIANGNNPLYIIDGVPFSPTTLTTGIGMGALGSPGNSPLLGLNPFNSLNNADIESIEVLKDADATAIYGSRGANGVILITTKKGKGGKTSFDANVYTGGGRATRLLPMMNTQQYLEMRREAFRNDGITQIPSNNYDVNGVWDTTRYTDWQKALIGGTAKFTNAQVSITGGNTNTQFVLAGGYSSQGTVYPGEYVDGKSSVRASATHMSPNHKFHASFSVTYTNDDLNIPQTDFATLITLAPDAPAIYNKDGSLNWQIVNNTVTWSNPFSGVVKHAKAVTDDLIGSANLGYEILPGLQLKTSLGYTHQQMNQDNTSPSTAVAPSFQNTPTYRSHSIATSDVRTWILEPQASYHRGIGEGQLDALIGVTVQQSLLNQISLAYSGFASDALINDLQAASTYSAPSIGNTQYRYNAVFSRLSYTYDDRYLLNLTARRDGSSRFASGKQFGNFWAIGAGWIFTKTKWAEDHLHGMNFGKLRVSYGTTGNDQLTDYQYLSSYNSTNGIYQTVPGLTPARLPNSNFGWEVVQKLEGGLETGWLQDRIVFTLSYYRNRTNNQLVGFPLPSIAGFTSVQANLPALVQNTGTEFELNTVNIRTRHFSWTTSLNISVPRNKLVSYPNLAASPYAQTYVVGQPLFIKFNYHNLGVNPQTGLWIKEDVNHDGQVNTANDYIPSKSVMQNYFGGFLNSFSYKGLQLDIFLQFVRQTGNNYLNYWTNTRQPGMFNINVPVYYLARWQQPGDQTIIQKFSTTYLPSPSDISLTDASFIRLKNLALSYTFPKRWQRWVRTQQARVYVQGQNLFIISRYRGFDPETQTVGLPPLRMLTAGIQLTW